MYFHIWWYSRDENYDEDDDDVDDDVDVDNVCVDYQNGYDDVEVEDGIGGDVEEANDDDYDADVSDGDNVVEDEW